MGSTVSPPSFRVSSTTSLLPSPSKKGKTSLSFQNTNRGKRSVTLDLRKAEGRDIFLRLVASADAVVENFRAGWLDSQGLDAATLHSANPRVVIASLSGFGQTGPRVGSFDAGFGASYMARIVGQKKAREIWYLCRQYNATEAFDMGLVNKVVPVENLEKEGMDRLCGDSVDDVKIEDLSLDTPLR